MLVERISKAFFLKEGDNNTGFFHRLANSHRQANTMRDVEVEGIMYEVESNIYDQVVGFYKSLYQESESWRPTDEVFKYPLVAWDKVVWPVEAGGLGIRRSGLFNEALLRKWLWCFGKEVTHLWCQVIATKYGEVSGGWCTRVVRGTHGRGLWKNIRKGAESFFVQAVTTLGVVLFL